MKNFVPYYLIEGIDLSGKSSVIRKLHHLNPSYTVRHSSLLGSNHILQVAKKIEKDGSEWIGHLYTKALEYDLGRFSWPTSATIQDSTILLRSLAYHAAAHFSTILARLETLALLHPKFTNVYILTASLEERRMRLRKRMKESPEKVTVNDLKVIRDPDFFLRMEEAMVNYASTLFDPIVIDTTNLTFDEVVKKIQLV